jgi:peptidoglycan/LPS O-acetylase OafA/YrhL
VDIFLFLSGFGIFRSLQRNSDPLRFLSRRMSRILPAYLPFIVVFCGFMLWAGQMTKWQALGNLTTFGWWSQMGAQFNWYIPTQIVLYMLSPLLFHIIDRYGRRALWVFPVMFLMEAACVGSSLMIGVSRFPVYFLGMFLGWEAARGQRPSKRHLWLSGVMAVLSMVALYFLVTRHPNAMARYGLWWHPFLLSTPGCLYFTTWLLEKQEKWVVTLRLQQLVEYLGGRSFEIYLCHILVYTVGLYFRVQGWFRWILLAIAGLVLGCCYHGFVEYVKSWRKP